MKAKSIFSFFLAGLAFLVGVVMPLEVVQHLTSDPLNVAAPVMGLAYVNFANLDGQSFQAPNPGGLRKVLVALSKHIQGIWPTLEEAQTGEVTALPLMVGTNKFAEYQFPDGTAEVASDSNGDPGFQSHKHTIELMLAGFSKAIQGELKKHLNAGSVWIVEMNDGQFVVVGSSDNPIFLKKSFKGGKKGNDKRGFTLKGDQDGFMWDLLPIQASLVATLPIQPEATT
ncbi:hypothetical protein [Larkinella terrae]|uniref:Uncharacterized protein n=1 Tax=Larkinella terrae TaxID=2025311 RepID=A0A7K0EJB7_9BACT|nr:hypothetical protein [Larkinella terrae]MRS61907.1 hypothetical protein [Larkinella terrae]